MTRPDFSTQLRNPMPDQTDQGAKIYTAMLERRLMYFIIRDIKLRSCLELATGVPYDSIDFESLTYEDLQELVAQDMARGLNLSIQEARTRVQANKITANPSQEESPNPYFTQDS
jgi:hypothetical protein